MCITALTSTWRCGPFRGLTLSFLFLLIFFCFKEIQRSLCSTVSLKLTLASLSPHQPSPMTFALITPFRSLFVLPITGQL